MSFPLLFFLLLGASLPQQEELEAPLPQQKELEKRIYSYWDLLLARDKHATLQYVESESRNRFIQRREPYFRSWEPIAIEKRSETEALVTVRIDRLMEASRTYYKTPVKEIWVLGGEGWQVRMPELSSKDLARLYSQKEEEKPAKKLTGELRILPRPIKINFFNPANLGSIFVFNGLSVPVRVTRVEVDEEKFQLKQKVDEVASGERGKITIRYLGDEEDKDLTSEIRVFVERVSEEAGEEVFAVPVLYNHLSPASRALFGLNTAKAKKLKRGDILRPVVRAPEEPKDASQALPLPKKPVAAPGTQAE